MFAVIFLSWVELFVAMHLVQSGQIGYFIDTIRRIPVLEAMVDHTSKMSEAKGLDKKSIRNEFLKEYRKEGQIYITNLINDDFAYHCEVCDNEMPKAEIVLVSPLLNEMYNVPILAMHYMQHHGEIVQISGENFDFDDCLKFLSIHYMQRSKN